MLYGREIHEIQPLETAVDQIVQATAWDRGATREDVLEHWHNGLAFEVPGRFYRSGVARLFEVPEGVE